MQGSLLRAYNNTHARISLSLPSGILARLLRQKPSQGTASVTNTPRPFVGISRIYVAMAGPFFNRPSNDFFFWGFGVLVMI